MCFFNTVDDNQDLVIQTDVESVALYNMEVVETETHNECGIERASKDMLDDSDCDSTLKPLDLGTCIII